jgi:hypothetical protein
MAIAFRSYSETVYATRTNTTIDKPTGTADGDILIAVIYSENNEVITPPADWASFSSVGVGWGGKNECYWKRASSEGASWTWTHANQNTQGNVFAYSGCIATGSPIDATVTTNDNRGGESTSVVGLSITTSTDNSMACMIWVNTSGSGTHTNPDGWTENGNPLVTYGILNKTITPAGATGNITITMSVSSYWATVFTALKVASGAAPASDFMKPSKFWGA